MFTSFYDAEGTFPEFRDQDVRTSWVDRASALRQRHRFALPILATVFRSMHVEADVVVCSSSGWAHGVATEGKRVVYCHSPAKWLHRREDYLGEHPGRLARLGLQAVDRHVRKFDHQSALRADTYVANSNFIADQVRDVYGIDAEVLPPPAGIGPHGPQEPMPGIEPGFFLTVARLLPYKNVHRTIEAFSLLPGERLVVVGEGAARAAFEALAPLNVRLLGGLADPQLRWLYANCRGVIAASREDFGLTSVESAAFGKPIAALRWGGFLDTIEEGRSGVFFDHPEPEEIAIAVQLAAELEWDAERIRAHAAVFREARFVERIRRIAFA